MVVACRIILPIANYDSGFINGDNEGDSSARLVDLRGQS